MAAGVRDLQLKELKDNIAQLNNTIKSQNELITELRKTIQVKQEQIIYLTKKLLNLMVPDPLCVLAGLFAEAVPYISGIDNWQDLIPFFWQMKASVFLACHSFRLPDSSLKIQPFYLTFMSGEREIEHRA